jgi:hypothetical protein
MRILLSFDTEDFTDPASNDVLLSVCRTLTERGARGTFGLVGEKARFIRDLGRRDVIEALAAHEIGYHTDSHFLFPDKNSPRLFASQVVEDLSWDDAVAWLTAQESRGMADIESLFGRRPTTALRTSGDSAPQILAAFRKLGLKTYGYGLALHDKTRDIARYAGMLCVSLPLVYENLVYEGHAEASLDAMAKSGVDMVNVRFHPCQFLADIWWDDRRETFAGNWDPPTRPPYVLAPHLPAEETRRRIASLGALVDMARKRGWTFATYDELNAEAGSDPAFISCADVLRAARAVRGKCSYVKLDKATLSLAETFAAVCWAALRPEAEWAPLRPVLGPVGVPSSPEIIAGGALTAEEIRRACAAAEEVVATKDRVPAEIELGGRRVPPAALLRAAASMLLGEKIALEKAPVYPEGFEEMLRQWEAIDWDVLVFMPQRGRPMPNTKRAIQLQYWTYKPAG